MKIMRLVAISLALLAFGQPVIAGDDAVAEDVNSILQSLRPAVMGTAAD